MAKPWLTLVFDAVWARRIAGAPTHKAAPPANTLRRPIAIVRSRSLPVSHFIYSAGELGHTMASGLTRCRLSPLMPSTEWGEPCRRGAGRPADLTSRGLGPNFGQWPTL